jgi:hypothetical protein
MSAGLSPALKISIQSSASPFSSVMVSWFEG